MVVSQDDPVHTKGEGWERQAKRTRDYFDSPGSTTIAEESLWEKQVTASVPQLYCSDRVSAKWKRQAISMESSTGLHEGTDFIWNKAWTNSCLRAL